MKNPPEADVKEFLRHSNAIEQVYDDAAFNQAMEAWDYLYNQAKVTPSVILKTHKVLMLHQPLYPHEKGYFRNVPVYVGQTMMLNHVLIDEYVENWCQSMNTPPRPRIKHSRTEDKAVQNLEELSRSLHVEYERIHPFVDGNGRTGRMFMNWWRITNGLPLLIIHEGDEQMEYYKWFR